MARNRAGDCTGLCPFPPNVTQAFGDDSDESSSSEEDEERQDQEWSGCDRNDGPSTNTTAADSIVVDNNEDITTASPTTCSQETISAAKKETRPAAVSTFKSGGSATVADTSTKAQKVEEVQDDDEYLDSIISQLATEAAAGGGGLSAADPRGASSPLAKFLRCDARCLKLDVELRRMFGAGVGGGGGDRDNAGAAGGGRARRTRRGMVVRGGNVPASLALKRLVISAPKEDWPKPPSLVGGGLGMSRCAPPKYLPQWQLEAHQGAEWFVFERSESLEQLQVWIDLRFSRTGAFRANVFCGSRARNVQQGSEMYHRLVLPVLR